MFEFDDDKNFAKVIGVGDFGSKAVNYLIENGLIDVEFVAVSSKNESLLKSAAQQKIKITDLHSEESNKKFSELVRCCW